MCCVFIMNLYHTSAGGGRVGEVRLRRDSGYLHRQHHKHKRRPRGPFEANDLKDHK
jgi:hypothetical protein